MLKISGNINVHILNASGKFSRFSNLICRNAKDSVTIIKSKIPISDTDIVIYDDPWATIKGKGIGGISRGANTVFVPLDLRFEHVETVINKEVPRTLAHELHHIARYREVGHRRTLLDGLIAEGLAGHFEIEIFGGEPQPWNQAFVKGKLNKLMKLAEKNYFKSNNPLKWFYGKIDKKIPKWAGYTIGFELVGRYLEKHSNKKASELYKTKSKKFI